MSMRSVACALLLLLGCDRVFSLDVPPERFDVEVTGETLYVTQTVLTEPMELATTRGAILVRDLDAVGGFRSEPMSHDGASLRATGVGDRRLVELVHPDGVRVLYDIPADQLHLREVIYGRKDAERVPPNAQIELAITLDRPAAAETYAAFTVGAWTSHAFPNSVLPAIGSTTWNPPPYVFERALFEARGEVSRLSPDDVIAVLRYAEGGVDGAMIVPGIAQRDGVDTIQGALATIPVSPFSFAIDAERAAARIGGIRPTPVLAWQVLSAPGASAGAYLGPSLAAGTVNETATTVSTSFGDPFADRGWPALVVWQAGGIRTASEPAPIALEARLLQFAPVTSTPVLDHEVGLPLLVSLEDTPLVSDGFEVEVDRTRAVMLEMVLDRRPPACDLHAFQISEVAPLTGARTSVVNVFSTEPSVEVPGDLFAPDTFYVIRARCSVGLPNAGAGDLTPALPFSLGSLDSAVFVTGPPRE